MLVNGTYVVAVHVTAFCKILTCLLHIAAVKVPCIFPILHKARIDNMKQYVERKTLRLREKQKEQKDEMPSTDDVRDRTEPKRHKPSADN